LSSEDYTEYDLVCCACGTGATLAGLVLSGGDRVKYLGFSSLKGGSFLHSSVESLIARFLMDEETAGDMNTLFTIDTRWHFGGYGKWNEELIWFIRSFEQATGVPLDQVYTGKLMYGLDQMIRNNEISEQQN